MSFRKDVPNFFVHFVPSVLIYFRSKFALFYAMAPRLITGNWFSINLNLKNLNRKQLGLELEMLSNFGIDSTLKKVDSGPLTLIKTELLN